MGSIFSPISPAAGNNPGMIVARVLCLGLLAQDPVPEPFPVRFLHEGACEAIRGEKPCREEGHWKVQAGERRLDGLEEFGAVVQKEADGHRTGAPRPELSERIVMLGGHRGVPFSTVMKTMRRCAEAGIYKLAWEKSGAETGEMGLKFRLADPLPPSELCLLKEEIRVVLKWDPKRGERIRWINGRSVGSTDELMKGIRTLVTDLRRMGREELPVFLDADRDLTWDDVAWKDVAEVMERCRAEGLESFEFQPLLRRKAAAKK